MHTDTVVITLDAQQMEMLKHSDLIKITDTRTELMFMLLFVSVKF